MKAQAYSYRVDEIGRIWPVCSTEDSTPLAKFSLDGIWPEVSATQAPRTDQRDLLRVAAAVAAVDRLSPRFPTGAKETGRQVRWQRDVRIEIAVEMPDLWRGAEGKAKAVIEFLTGDRWELQFVPVERRYVQGSLMLETEQRPTEVALFSGGLDSAAGLAARDLEVRANFVAVSVSGTPVRDAAQERAVFHLQQLGIRVRRVALSHQLHRTIRRSIPDDMPRRARGFLFLAAGAVAASRSGAKSLSVYETGIGALNLRTSSAQLGPETTRAVHPRTLVLMEHLLSEVLDQPISIELPFLFKTKRELCRSLGSDLVPIARLAMSCDEGEGHKPESMLHCGVCTSCLFRRVALLDAPDPTSYRCTAGRTHDGYDLVAFELQALQIQKWNRGFESLARTDPDGQYVVPYAISRGLSAEQARDRIFAAYQRYAREAVDFIDSVRPTIISLAPKPEREVQDALFA